VDKLPNEPVDEVTEVNSEQQNTGGVAPEQTGHETLSKNTPHEEAKVKAAELAAQAVNLRKEAEKLDEEAIQLTSAAESSFAAMQIAQGTGNVAVFLGAGSSKAFGWPLTKELLPLILNGLEHKTLFKDSRVNDEAANEADRQLLRTTLSALCPGVEFVTDFLTQNKQKLPLVTSLLSMLDYSLNANQALVLGLTPEKIRDARTLLERSIYEAIEHQSRLRGSGQGTTRAVNDYPVELLKWLDRIRKQNQIGIITSNYDVAIEKAWRCQDYYETTIDDLGLDLGFPWAWPSNSYPVKIVSRPASPKKRLFKLHGSTNWLRCGLCDQVYVNLSVDIAAYAYKREEDLNSQCHCKQKLEVQIVSPSFVREMRAPNLLSVWQRALDWLRSSNVWIIVGYSFPDEDLNIRSLFTRALASLPIKPQVTVIQRGNDDETRMRYQAFFPKGKLTFLSGGLDVFLDSVR